MSMSFIENEFAIDDKKCVCMCFQPHLWFLPGAAVTICVAVEQAGIVWSRDVTNTGTVMMGVMNATAGQVSTIEFALARKVLVTTIDAQWEEMGDVGSARYKPALLPPCPTIRVLSYSN